MADERRRRRKSQPANTGGKVMLSVFAVMFVLSLGIYLNEKVFRFEWIPTSAEIISAIKGEHFSEVGIERRAETALRQLRLAIEDKGERVAIPEARKQIALYLHGFRGASALRAKINASTTYAEVEAAFAEILKEQQ